MLLRKHSMCSVRGACGVQTNAKTFQNFLQEPKQQVWKDIIL